MDDDDGVLIGDDGEVFQEPRTRGESRRAFKALAEVFGERLQRGAPLEGITSGPPLPPSMLDARIEAGIFIKAHDSVDFWDTLREYQRPKVLDRGAGSRVHVRGRRPTDVQWVGGAVADVVKVEEEAVGSDHVVGDPLMSELKVPLRAVDSCEAVVGVSVGDLDALYSFVEGVGFVCDSCSNPARTRNHARHHAKRRLRLFQCGECAQAFGERRDLDRHHSSVHTAAKIQCSCGASTGRSDNFHRHWKKRRRRSSSDPYHYKLLPTPDPGDGRFGYRNPGVQAVATDCRVVGERDGQGWLWDVD